VIDMDKPRFILDSNILIAALNEELDIFAVIAELSPCDVFINLVVEIETFAKPDMTGEEEARGRVLLSEFKWAEIDRAAREYAIDIRRSKKLLLPDALIAATAISLNATVISNDPHLRDFQWPGYSARPWRCM
jgi:predicted nucleic acid-binding protein